MNSTVVEIKDLFHRYKTREALSGLSLRVAPSETFAFLGPNGSGKTTLFKILSTSFLPSSGDVKIHGLDLRKDVKAIRRKIGVVFQSPSLDRKLTVRENLMHQGHLYGLHGHELKQRSEEMLERLGIGDRAGDLTEKLSGGLKRRVELAKGLLHRPELLLLDEPSTGLDPGARIDLWKYLHRLREREGVTILVTTHLMDEAEQCDRVAILNEGKLVCDGKPEALKKEVSGDVVLVQAHELKKLAEKIEEKFQTKIIMADGSLQIEHEHGAQFVARLVEAFPGEIQSVTFRKPTLEDVFIHQTGHQFWEEKKEAEMVSEGRSWQS